MNRKVRLINLDEIEQVMKIYDTARKFMIENNNPNQWVNYPNIEEIESNIKNNTLYTLENEKDEKLAIFQYMKGPDPTYKYIKGKWLNDKPYYVIHKLASTFKEKGIFKDILEYAFIKGLSIRIDTYKDNLPMQKVLKKEGFIYCGIIYLSNNSPRLAFQKDKE